VKQQVALPKKNMEGKLLNKIYTFSCAEAAHNVEKRKQKGFLTLKVEAQKKGISFVLGSFLFLSIQ